MAQPTNNPEDVKADGVSGEAYDAVGDLIACAEAYLAGKLTMSDQEATALTEQMRAAYDTLAAELERRVAEQEQRS